jgi:IS30 family transposase
MKKEKNRTFTRLRLAEVQEIFVMRSDKKSIRQIAEAIGRSTSTVSRTLGKYQHPSKAVWRTMSALERAKDAFDRMKVVRTEGGNHGRIRDGAVLAYVLDALVNKHWSPEEIAGRIRIDLPGRKICAKRSTPT